MHSEHQLPRASVEQNEHAENFASTHACHGTLSALSTYDARPFRLLYASQAARQVQANETGIKQTNQLSYMAHVKQTLTNAGPDETAQEEERSTDNGHAESTETL